MLLSFCAVPELRLRGQSHCWLICTPLGCARASLQRPSPLFSHLRTWCVLHSSTSVHIHCSLSIVPFLIVSCLVVSSACVCVCLETPYCPCSVYNLQVGRTNTLVSFPHLQSPWCSVTQGPFQTHLLTHHAPLLQHSNLQMQTMLLSLSCCSNTMLYKPFACMLKMPQLHLQGHLYQNPLMPPLTILRSDHLSNVTHLPF